MVPALPDMKAVSLTEGGTPEPTLSEVAFTRTLEIVIVKLPAGSWRLGKLIVEPLTVPRT
jgi:hypothetical protein